MEKKQESTVSVTKEQVKTFCKADLDAAIYFLHIIKTHPDLIDRISDILYDHHTSVQPIIDRVTNKPEA